MLWPGDTGHKGVSEIAFRMAQSDARTAIRKLIRSATESDTLTDFCVYRDHLRQHADWHFTSLPRTAHGLTSDECPQTDAQQRAAVFGDRI